MLIVTGGAINSLYLPDVQELDYVPNQVANDYQNLNLYLPDSDVYTRPSAGWPVVVRINITGDFTASTKSSDLSADEEARAFLEAGFALCDATTTYTTAGGGVTNGGLFTDPDEAGWDGAADIPEQDVVFIIQKLRDLDGELAIDPNAIALYGIGQAAATVCAWVSLSADFADSGGATTQQQQSSVPNACWVEDPQVWSPAMQDTTAQNHLRDSVSTSSPAATLADATEAHRRQSSPIYRTYLDSTAGAVPMVVRTTSSPPGSTNLRTDGNPWPILDNTLSSFTDAWHAQMLMAYERAHGQVLFYRSQSSLIASQEAERGNVDRVVAGASAATLGHPVAFFRSTIGALGGVDEFDVRYGFLAPMETDRAGVVDGGGATAQGRQTRTSWSQGRLTASDRRWEVGANDASASEVTALRAIRTNARGPVRAFEFPMPDAAGSVLAFFVENSLRIRNVAHGVYRWRAQLREAV